MADFGGVVTGLLKGRQYKGAQWNKIPAPYLVSLKLNCRQLALYVRLSASATTTDNQNAVTDLPSGITEMSVREYAKSWKVTERTVRRDLQLLQKNFLIRYVTKPGSRAQVAIIDPRFIPAIGALATRNMPHLQGEQLLDIIHDLCIPTQSESRTPPHPMSEELRRKELLKQSLTIARNDALAAPSVPIEWELRKEFLDITTQSENSPADAGLVSQAAIAAALNAALDGPRASFDGPSAPSDKECDLSVSQAAVEPLKSGKVGLSASASEGGEFLIDQSTLLGEMIARMKTKTSEVVWKD